MQLPPAVYFHKLGREGIGQITIGDSNTLPYGGFQHNIYLVSFAKAQDFAGSLGPGISITDSEAVAMQDFLEDQFDHHLMGEDQAWDSVTHLLTLAWERFMKQSGLGLHLLSNRQTCYYFQKGRGEGRIPFSGVDGQPSWRSLMGYKTVKEVSGAVIRHYWHFAIQGKPMLHPMPLYIIKPHVVFSDDQQTIWGSKLKLHKARRSWCKDWWNDAWRDRLLASMTFLADSKPVLQIPVGSDTRLDVDVSPVQFNSPVTYADAREGERDKTDAREHEEVSQDIEVADDLAEYEDDWEDIEDE